MNGFRVVFGALHNVLLDTTEIWARIREMERNRKSASLITQSVLIISIENSFVLALIRSLE